jgi:GT2 family glycosyltransferase
MMPKVYILLPVHNRKALTQSFIGHLATQTYSNVHLLLIDDGSTDGTEEMVRAMVKDLTVIKGKGNWWWAGSLQKGIDWLKDNSINNEDVVLMINDDVEIPPDFIETGCALLRSGVLIQAAICDDTTREILDIGVVYEDQKMLFREPSLDETVNCLTTNGLFIRWRDLQVVGGFYPRLLPHYLSDYEFTIRAYKKGLILLVSSDLKLYWNRETTGIRIFEDDSLLPFLKKFFSKKAAGNPVYWTSFVILVSPMKYLPLHLAKIWTGALFTIVKQVLRILLPMQKQA